MRKVIGMAVALQLVFAVCGARAEEINGKVKSLDATKRVLTFQDGTRLWVAEGLSMNGLKEGASVRVTYETRDGDRIATSIEGE